VQNAEPTDDKTIVENNAGADPLPREAQRQIVVEVLAIAVVDLLLEERSRVRDADDAATC